MGAVFFIFEKGSLWGFDGTGCLCLPSASYSVISGGVGADGAIRVNPSGTIIMGR